MPLQVKMLFFNALVIALLVECAVAKGETAQNPLPALSTGQRIYVPVYSSIRYLNDAEYDLAVTISIRNTEPDHAIRVTSALYYDNDGKRVRDFLAEPHTLPGFGSMELFIRQADLRGQAGANFIVEWKADKAVSAPLVEAVMIGSRGSQGIAFTSRGIVLGQ